MLDELELKQRYQDYLREVRQEQRYQQVKAYKSKKVHLVGSRILILATKILSELLNSLL